ncbi:MAG TPA: hypothetical protein DIT97_06230 [Gimesia maris]|uniref:Uncharacterized protein n=1 Tax=Gimesia maris TaxID=122 RepID=A0A3D3R378_9PLAN|nr:hypothetical protein [Gimesia maris]|tara:strand:- start:1310 stop:2161 length:852 start_codon:yes stop_codon:yes gene_type:complete
MPLRSEIVKQRSFITNGTTNRYREVGYDLTIGDIFVPKDGSKSKYRNKIVNEYEVPPQGVVVIFSRETIEIPEDICAYAMPKTSLCSEGILVFNTGIVDPGYRGLLSATTVNFSDSPVKLSADQPFLRLVFEPLSAQELQEKPQHIEPLSQKERKTYINEKLVSARNFHGTFLNIPGTVEAVSKEIINKERNFLIWVITILSVFFTLLTVIPTIIPKDYLPNTPTKNQIDSLAKEYAMRETMTNNIENLADKMTKMENQLKKSKSELDHIRKQLPARAEKPGP